MKRWRGLGTTAAVTAQNCSAKIAEHRIFHMMSGVLALTRGMRPLSPNVSDYNVSPITDLSNNKLMNPDIWSGKFMQAGAGWSVGDLGHTSMAWTASLVLRERRMLGDEIDF
jgi:hypothetical protein